MSARHPKTRRGIRLAISTVTLIFMGWAVGCGAKVINETTPAEDAGAPDVAPDRHHCPSRAPKAHRAVSKDCVPTAMPSCVSDDDCPVTSHIGAGTYTKGAKCLQGADGKRCAYDQCKHDSDCLTGTDVCVCAADVVVSPPANGSTCVVSACRTDADCGEGLYCSPSVLVSCGTYVDGYYCHTCDDTCLDDADCASGLCSYDPALGHWACNETLCTG